MLIPLPSPMEIRVLELVAVGETARRIAVTLRISEQGVRYHIGNLRAKLQAPNAPSLIARAVALGFLDCDAWPPRAENLKASRAAEN
jgi:DNA-binding CsgD family transcriptional regulator